MCVCVAGAFYFPYQPLLSLLSTARKDSRPGASVLTSALFPSSRLSWAILVQLPKWHSNFRVTREHLSVCERILDSTQRTQRCTLGYKAGFVSNKFLVVSMLLPSGLPLGDQQSYRSKRGMSAKDQAGEHPQDTEPAEGPAAKPHFCFLPCSADDSPILD